MITKLLRGEGQGVSRNYFILLYLELIRNFIEIYTNTVANKLGGVTFYFTGRFPIRQCVHVRGRRFDSFARALKICKRPYHSYY
jgi:hypothetical protein